jgi:hypothetical protein
VKVSPWFHRHFTVILWHITAKKLRPRWLFFYYFILYISIWYRFFFRDDSMAYILFIGYMRLSMHLVLRILSNPRIYIVVLLYKSLSNPNILIGLYWCYFFFLSRVDNHLCFINVRMCLFLCSAHIELGHYTKVSRSPKACFDR